MVSEGVDVPRAACLAWMTSYRTPLFFAQGVGRVVRARRPGESATVFLPAVRPLLALAAELEQERNHVIPPPSQQDEELLDVERDRARSRPSARCNELVDADASFAHVLHGGRAVVAERPRSPTTTRTSSACPASCRRSRPPPCSPVATRTPGSGPPGTPQPRAVGASRRRRRGGPAPSCAARSTAWSDSRGAHRAPHGQIHAETRRAVPGPASAAASADVLERRRDHLMERLGG